MRLRLIVDQTGAKRWALEINDTWYDFS